MKGCEEQSARPWNTDWTSDPEALLLVSLQHVGEAKAHAAHVTRVRLFSCMGPTVTFHVWATGEAFATDFTYKRFLSCKKNIY